MCPQGLPSFSLDKLLASISPCGLVGKETLVRGVDLEEKAGTFPHRPHSQLPYFQLPWHYSLGLTNIKHKGCNSCLYGNNNTTLNTRGNKRNDKRSRHFNTNCTLLTGTCFKIKCGGM